MRRLGIGRAIVYHVLGAQKQPVLVQRPGTMMRRCSPSPSMRSRLRLRSAIALIGRDPIGADRVLGNMQVEAAEADQFMQARFQRIFDARVPGPRAPVLGPEIRYVVGAAETERDKVVNLVVTSLHADEAVLAEDLPVHVGRNVAHPARVAGSAERVMADDDRGAGRELRIGADRVRCLGTRRRWRPCQCQYEQGENGERASNPTAACCAPRAWPTLATRTGMMAKGEA